MWVQSLGREDPLEKETATHSSILAWRIPWTEEPWRLQSIAQCQTWLKQLSTYVRVISINSLTKLISRRLFLYFQRFYGFRNYIQVFNPFWVHFYEWYKTVTYLSLAYIYPIFPTPFIEEIHLFSTQYSWLLFMAKYHSIFSSLQFSSVAQSCPTLWDPMDCSMPSHPVHHQLPEFTQTHVHCGEGNGTPL